MKCIILLSFSCFLLISCNKVDCTTDDPIFRSLFIKLLDADGNNLIENDTFNSETITIRFSEAIYTGVVFTDVQGIENLIIINLLGQEGSNIYEIQLSESRTDILELAMLEIGKDEPCPASYFIPDGASYNRVDQTIEVFGDDFMITVIL